MSHNSFEVYTKLVQNKSVARDKLARKFRYFFSAETVLRSVTVIEMKDTAKRRTSFKYIFFSPRSDQH